MTRRALLYLLTPLAALCAQVVGCLSPTLPLPPPNAPDHITLSDPDQLLWDLRGTNTAGAVVIIENLETAEIFGFEDRDRAGKYLIQVSAQPCDRAEIYEIVGTTITPPKSFVIAPTAIDASITCP